MNGKSQGKRNVPRRFRGGKTSKGNSGRNQDATRVRRLNEILRVARSARVSTQLRNGNRRDGHSRRGKRASKGSRSNVNGPRSGTNLNVVVAQGSQVGSGLVTHKTNTHITRGSYENAVSHRFRAMEKKDDKFENAPVSQGSVVHFSGVDEHRSIKHDGEHLLVSGRMFLGAVEHPDYLNIPSNPVIGVGRRLLVATLSPDALGGRLGIAAKSFQQNRLKRGRFLYCSAIGTQMNGQIAMGATNDTSLTMSVIGEEEFAHTTEVHKSEAANVWMDMELPFKPKLQLKAYEDDAADAMETPGLFWVETATLVNFTDLYTAQGQSALGNVFFDYEYEFYNPALSYTIPARQEGQLTLKATAVVGAPTDFAPVQCVTDPNGDHVTPVTGILSLQVQQMPAGITDTRELSSYVFVATAAFCKNSVTGVTSWSAFDPQIASLVSIELGIGACFRFTPYTIGGFVGDTLCIMYPSLKGASESIGAVGGSDNSDQNSYQWKGQTFASLGTQEEYISFSGFWHSID